MKTTAVLNRARIAPLVALAAWTPLLVYLALLPRVPRVPWASDSLAATAGHFISHGVLAALLYWFLSPRGGDRSGRLRAVALAVAISSATGVALEGLQAARADVRTFQLVDVVADVAGASLSVMGLFVMEDLGVRRGFLWAATVLAGAGLGVGAITSIMIWDPRLPYIGDHWHAQLAVAVCGELLPPFPAFPGSVHSHGDRIIHIHPLRPEEEGANATLGLFLTGAGARLTESTLTLPSGETYTSGDTCPDGQPTELRVFDYDPRTGTRLARIPSPSTYVPRDRQTILIEFMTPASP